MQTALGAASLAGLAVIVVFSFVVLIRLETLTSQPEKRRRFLRWWAPMVIVATLIGLVGLTGQLLLS
nr:hypothetical protein DA06_24795 [Georgenia sp. SUBG003]KEP24113.1 hypothetical protein DA06_23295 [Georgenia sp. SUBG003]